MTMSSALGAGISGLNAHAMRLATISDNISNSGTYGYKRVETDFSSIVLGEGGSTGMYFSGGVRGNAHRIVDQAGGLVGTSHPLDLAITGRGMLPVTSIVDIRAGDENPPMMMTRTGGFRADAAGILRTDSGLVLMGLPADADGRIPAVSRDTSKGLAPIDLSSSKMAANPTSTITLGINLPAEETRPTASGAPLDVRVEYFGNLGTSDTVGITFTPKIDPAAAGTSNIWTAEFRDSASATPTAVIGTIELEFHSGAGMGGVLKGVTLPGGPAHPDYDAATGALTLNLASGPISVALGKLDEPGGISQMAGSFSTTGVTKDGSPVGQLNSVEVDANGYLRATYDSGFTKVLYQVPVVDVPNPNGLAAVNNQAFKMSPDSGGFFLWNAGDGPTGAISGYTREESTTDVAAELTDLITTQRAYSSNAKVIQTVDEMLQETTNIKR